MRATIIAAKDEAGEFELYLAWFARWQNQLAVCSDERGCGCCVLTRDVDATAEALAELPARMLAASEWSRPAS